MFKKFIALFILINFCKGKSRRCEVFDLSWPFNNETIFWGASEGFQFTNQIVSEQPNGVWFAMNDFKSSEHGGTHLDAPYHFSQTGWKVGDIPLKNLLASGIKIDLSDNSNRDTVLLPKHLIDWKNKYGPIPTDSVILVYFNWSVNYHNKTEYLGGTNTNNYRFPGVSAEAAEWIVKNTKIVGIGLDTASVDPGVSTTYPAHRKILSKNIYVLENVKIPNSLPVKGFKLVVMPMKIEEGTGAPTRLIAFTKAC